MSTSGSGSAVCNHIAFPYEWEHEGGMYRIVIPSIGYDEWRGDLDWGVADAIVKRYVNRLLRERHLDELARLKKWKESTHAA